MSEDVHPVYGDPKGEKESTNKKDPNGLQKTGNEDSETSLRHVLDEESGQIVEITDDMRHVAQTIQQRIQGATIATSILIQIVRDQKLYLAYGCGSFKDYAENMLPFSPQQAKKYLKIADTYAPLIGDFKGASMRLLNKKLHEIEDEGVKELGSLGMSKLYELTKIPEADFDEVVSKGVVKLKDGSEISIDEIKDQTAREFTKQISEIKKDYQKRISRLEEENRKVKGEYKHAVSEKNKIEQESEYAKNIEAQFGSIAHRTGEINTNLNLSDESLAELNRFFARVEVPDDDEKFGAEKQRVLSILRSVLNIHEMAKRRMPWLNDMHHYEAAAFPIEKFKEVQSKNSNDFDPDATIDDVKVIRTDLNRMVIKCKSNNGKYSHGWKNLEADFESEEEMQQRYDELIESGKYVEG